MRFLLISTLTLAIVNSACWTAMAVSMPPTAGLEAWYRADTGVTPISGGVSQWNDQSGNGSHAMQGTANGRPSLSSALMPIGATLPVITYGNNSDGSYDQLNLTGVNQDGGSGATVYLVVNDDADGTTSTRNWINRDTSSGPPYAPAIYGNPGAFDAGLYLNTFSYKLADPLTLIADVGFYTPFYSSLPGMRSSSLRDSQQGSGVVFPHVGLEYRPSKNTSLSLHVFNGPDAAKAYGYDGFLSPWAR